MSINLLMIIGDIMKKYTCKKCNHLWYPRTPNKPVLCPLCKSSKWDEDAKKRK